MPAPEPADLNELAVLRSIVEGTATETGLGFFAALVENLRAAMGTMGAWVAVYDEPARRLRAISMRMRERSLDGFVYPIDGTPCQTALEEFSPWRRSSQFSKARVNPYAKRL